VLKRIFSNFGELGDPLKYGNLQHMSNVKLLEMILNCETKYRSNK
jgi:hypothetical protein